MLEIRVYAPRLVIGDEYRPYHPYHGKYGRILLAQGDYRFGSTFQGSEGDTFIYDKVRVLSGGDGERLRFYERREVVAGMHCSEWPVLEQVVSKIADIGPSGYPYVAHMTPSPENLPYHLLYYLLIHRPGPNPQNTQILTGP